jgi:hypothetical protein
MVNNGDDDEVRSGSTMSLLYQFLWQLMNRFIDAGIRHGHEPIRAELGPRDFGINDARPPFHIARCVVRLGDSVLTLL